MEDQEIYDELNKIPDIIEEERPSKFKKTFIIIIAVFLMFLLVTYLTSNSLISNIFIGLIQSDKINNNIVSINSTNNLIFQDNVYDDLLKIYDSNPELEFKVCLNGKILNGDYYINDIYVPETYLQTSNKVIADSCPDYTIVDMHSHPLKHCVPSEQDFNSFKLFKEKNNNAIMAVMCERGRFNFYVWF